MILPIDYFDLPFIGFKGEFEIFLHTRRFSVRDDARPSSTPRLSACSDRSRAWEIGPYQPTALERFCQTASFRSPSHLPD